VRAIVRVAIVLGKNRFGTTPKPARRGERYPVCALSLLKKDNLDE
jgi:hypothetical protein